MTRDNSRIAEYVEDRRYMGDMVDPTLIGRSSLDGQAPHTTLQLRLDQGIVMEARFRTSGCGFLIACCGALVELIVNRSLAECHSLTAREIIDALDGLPQHRRYCADLAIAALQDALSASANTCVSRQEA